MYPPPWDALGATSTCSRAVRAHPCPWILHATTMRRTAGIENKIGTRVERREKGIGSAAPLLVWLKDTFFARKSKCCVTESSVTSAYCKWAQVQHAHDCAQSPENASPPAGPLLGRRKLNRGRRAPPTGRRACPSSTAATADRAPAPLWRGPIARSRTLTFRSQRGQVSSRHHEASATAFHATALRS